MAKYKVGDMVVFCEHGHEAVDMGDIGIVKDVDGSTVGVYFEVYRPDVTIKRTEEETDYWAWCFPHSIRLYDPLEREMDKILRDNAQLLYSPKEMSSNP